MIETVRLSRVQAETLSTLGLLEDSINMAMIGRLPPFLVNATVVREGIEDISAHLQKQNRRVYVLHKDVSFYYEQGQIYVTRVETADGVSSLVIVLAVPLTMIPHPMRLFEVVEIPLQYPGNHAHTVLHGLPKALLFSDRTDYYMSFQNFADTPTGNSLRVGLGSEVLRRSRQPSCILALFHGDLQKIDQLCDYRAVAEFPKIAIRLSESIIFLSGYTKVNLMCETTDDVTEIIISEPQIIYKIECGCSLLTTDYMLPAVKTDCHSSNNSIDHKIIVLYATNLPVLRKYFNELQLAGIQVHTLLENNLEVQLPDLKITESKLIAIDGANIALQNKAQFKLQKIINASITNQRSFTSLAEWLLEQSTVISQRQDEQEKARRTFDVTSPSDWLNVLATLLGIMGFAIAIWTRMRLHALTVALTVKGTQAYVLTLPSRLFFVTTPTVTAHHQPTIDTPEQSQVFLDAVKTYIPLEVTIIISAVALSVIAITYGVWRYLQNSNSLSIFLIVGNAETQFEVKVMTLVRHIKGLVFDITALTSSIGQLQLGCVCTNVHLNIANVTLNHETLNVKYKLPDRFMVNAWKTRQLQSIIKDDYYMLLVVKNCHGNEITHVVAKAMSDDRDGRATVLIESRNIYPDLEPVTEQI